MFRISQSAKNFTELNSFQVHIKKKKEKNLILDNQTGFSKDGS